MLDQFIQSVRSGQATGSGNTGSVSGIYGYGAAQNGTNTASGGSYLDQLLSSGTSGFGGTSLQPGQTAALPDQIPGTKGFFTYDLNGDGNPERYFEAEQDGQGYKKGDILVAGTGNSYLMNDPAMSGYYMQFYGNDDINKDGRADPSITVGGVNLRNIGQAADVVGLKDVFASTATAPVWFIPTDSVDVNQNGTPEARYFMTDGTSVLSSVFITGYGPDDTSDGAKVIKTIVEKIEDGSAELGQEFVLNGQNVKVRKIEHKTVDGKEMTYVYVEGFGPASSTTPGSGGGGSGSSEIVI